jgi:uncharacterized membrane protein
MLKTLTFAAIATALIAAPASAESWYEFQAKNNATTALTVSMDGSTACKASAGDTCTVKISMDRDHTFAYAFEGGRSANFEPGNLEIADVCRFDDKGAHCVDTQGKATN